MRNLTRTRRLGSSLVLAGLLLTGAAALAPAAGAATDNVQTIEDPKGGKDCQALAPDGQIWTEYKVDAADLPPAGESKTYDEPQTSMEITVSNVTGTHLDWASNLDMAAVLVKGGPVVNVYRYPGAADLHDEGLHAPENPNGKPDGTKYYGISHVSFCFASPVVDPDEFEMLIAIDPSPVGPPDGGGDGDPRSQPDGNDAPPHVACVEGNTELCEGLNTQPPSQSPPAEPPAEELVPQIDRRVDQQAEVLSVGGAAVKPAPELPRTGSATGTLAVAGALLVTLGGATRSASRLAHRTR